MRVYPTNWKEPEARDFAERSKHATVPRQTPRHQIAERRQETPQESRYKTRQKESDAGPAISEFLQKLKEQRAIEALKLEEAAAAAKMSAEQLLPNQDTAVRDDLSPIWKDPTIPISQTSPPKPATSSTTLSPEMNTIHSIKAGESTSSGLAESSAVASVTSQETGAAEPTAASLHIKLGLDRITALLAQLGNPQDHIKVIHVAGTNGKGSTCAYLTSVLIAADKKVGQFTSPHLIDRWDGISINNCPISAEDYWKLEREVIALDKEYNIKASTFEILTACALTYFARENVDLAVIETGMGGTKDATNVFRHKNVLVSVITPISLHHKQYLGNTVEEIAVHKAGIMKNHVPVVVAPHPPQIHRMLEEIADSHKSKFCVAQGHWNDDRQTRYVVENVRFAGGNPDENPTLSVVPGIPGAEQAVNVACAVRALSLLQKRGIRGITERAVHQGIASASLPGRMEWVRFETEDGQIPMLLDGAHNPASCRALGTFVTKLRKGNPVVWIVAFSRGRDVRACMGKFVQPGDCVAAVEFGPVDRMPWVRPVDAEEVAEHANVWCQNPGGVMNFGRDIVSAIRWGIQERRTRRGMLAATGSLYLVGDVHRLRRESPDPDSDSE